MPIAHLQPTRTMKRTALRFALLAGIASPLCAQAPEIIHYTFDAGDATNIAVPGIGNGIDNGEVSYTTGVNCPSGSAAESSGSNPSIDTGWQMDLGTGDWTVGWHLSQIDSSTSLQYFMGSSSAGGFRAFSGGVAGADGIMLRTLMGGDVTIAGGAPANGTSHVVWVHDSSVPEVRGYLDGVLQLSVTQTSPGTGIDGTAADFEIMNYTAGVRSGNAMDDFRFYRRAITDAEIMAWAGCDAGGFDTFCDPMDPNSTGASTTLSGSLNLGVGSGLHLEATDGPPGEFGYFLIGTAPSDPGLVISQGRLCLAVSGGNGFGRYNVTGGNLNSVGQFDAAGVLQNLPGTSTSGTGFDVPLNVPIPGFGNIQAGETWHFQLWHREAAGASNFSNGITVMF